MEALIDADIVAYRCAAVNEESDEGIARWQVDELMGRILRETESKEFKAFLTGDNNFRKHLYPEYKANRPDKKPKWLEQCREHLVRVWDATITDGYEADDALGMAQDNGWPTFDIPPECLDTVICSIDKDLLMIPGHHYNFVKQIWSTVSPSEAMLSFYTSVLIGDTVDNIKGCPKIGKAKAPRILEGCNDELSMYNACLKQYVEAFKSHEEGEKQLHLNAKLLWIMRSPDDIWKPPLGLEQQ